MFDPADVSAPAATPDMEAFDYYVDQLETYLDGELAPHEAAGVRARLAEEPSYAAALARLAESRRHRMDAFAHLTDDPADDEAAERLCVAARALTTRATVEGGLARPSRGMWWFTSAAAACVAAGFLLGSLGGFDLGTRQATPVANPLPGGGAALVSDTRETRDSREPQRVVPADTLRR